MRSGKVDASIGVTRASFNEDDREPLSSFVSVMSRTIRWIGVIFSLQCPKFGASQRCTVQADEKCLFMPCFNYRFKSVANDNERRCTSVCRTKLEHELTSFQPLRSLVETSNGVV